MKNYILADLLIDVSQLLNGWHQDGTAWTEWDQSEHNRVTEAITELTRPTAIHKFVMDDHGDCAICGEGPHLSD